MRRNNLKVSRVDKGEVNWSESKVSRVDKGEANWSESKSHDVLKDKYTF